METKSEPEIISEHSSVQDTSVIGQCTCNLKGFDVKVNNEICTICLKPIDEEERLVWSCEKCNTADLWIKFPIISAMDGRSRFKKEPTTRTRTMIGDKLVEFTNPPYGLLCEKCISELKDDDYKVLPTFIQCDMCHSDHYRVFCSDGQGYGLCGTVQETIHPPIEYVIPCGFGSRYDSCGILREYVRFAGNKLPENVKIGMNICDNCITKLIINGACTYFQPITTDSVASDYLEIPSSCINARPGFF